MINRDELAICKRRGHDAGLLGEDWSLCKWCGTWLRELRTIEEREDEPPKSRQNPLGKILRHRPEGGRPRSNAPGCPCGGMTLKCALARGHKCAA